MVCMLMISLLCSSTRLPPRSRGQPHSITLCLRGKCFQVTFRLLEKRLGEGIKEQSKRDIIGSGPDRLWPALGACGGQHLARGWGTHIGDSKNACRPTSASIVNRYIYTKPI